MYNEEGNNLLEKEFARNSILLNQFCRIMDLCGIDAVLVPLKGVSLLFTLYKDDYARNVGDIDFLIEESKVGEAIGKLQQAGYVLRSKKATANRLISKRKFDMVHVDKRFCDLDIHVDLVTKKFFRITTGDFTSFAMSRLQKINYKGYEISLLSPVDEWLYLAQHYCFHLFSQDKWLKDLYLLQSGFSEKERMELIDIAGRFNLKRVVTACSQCLRTAYAGKEIKIPHLIEDKPLFFNLILRRSSRRYDSRKRIDRLIAAYWEFLFIDNAALRAEAFLCLLFPSFSMFCSIYTLYSLPAFILLYSFHIVLVLFSSLLFFPALLAHRIIK